MSSLSTPPSKRQDGLLALLCLATLVAFTVITLPLAVLPLYVHQHLGYGAAVAGSVIGVQFLATFLTRGWAGALSDRLGARRMTRLGFGLCVLSGAVLLIAALVRSPPPTSVALLMAARLVMGLGESQVVIGVLAWGIGTVGPTNSGKVMSWVGMVIYGALACGAPLGLWVDAHFGLVGLAVVMLLLPLLAFIVTLPIPAVSVVGGRRGSMLQVIRRIWAPGVALALQGVGFAAIGAFCALYFAARGWSGAGLALTAFGLCFALSRAIGGHLPDRMGGPRVAIAVLVIEAGGLLLLALAPNPGLALAGAGLTGLGASLVYPCLGLVVISKVEPSDRSTALGAYTAFQDIAYGLTGPFAGLLAERAGYSSAFLTAAAAALGALVLTLPMALRSNRSAAAELS